MEYADVIWSGCTDTESDLLEHADVQYEAAKVVTGAIKGTSRQRLLEELGWESIKTRRIIHRIVLFYKIVNNYIVQLSSLICYRLKFFKEHIIPCVLLLIFQFLQLALNVSEILFSHPLLLYGINLSTEIRNIESIGSFKEELKFISI